MVRARARYSLGEGWNLALRSLLLAEFLERSQFLDYESNFRVIKQTSPNFGYKAMLCTSDKAGRTPRLPTSGGYGDEVAEHVAK